MNVVIFVFADEVYNNSTLAVNNILYPLSSGSDTTGFETSDIPTTEDPNSNQQSEKTGTDAPEPVTQGYTRFTNQSPHTDVTIQPPATDVMSQSPDTNQSPHTDVTIQPPDIDVTSQSPDTSQSPNTDVTNQPPDIDVTSQLPDTDGSRSEVLKASEGSTADSDSSHFSTGTPQTQAGKPGVYVRLGRVTGFEVNKTLWHIEY